MFANLNTPFRIILKALFAGVHPFFAMSAEEQHRVNLEELVNDRAAAMAVRLARQMVDVVDSATPTSQAAAASAAVPSLPASDDPPNAEPFSPVVAPMQALSPYADTPAGAIAGAPAAAASAAAAAGADDEDDDLYGTDNHFDLHAEEFDAAADGFTFTDRVVHFCRGNIINNDTRQSVEICVLIEVGTQVSNDKTMKGSDRDNLMLTKYRDGLDFFDDSFFASPRLRDEMKKKLYNAKKDINGPRLWETYNKWKQTIRNEFTSKLPTNLSSIPSGNQLQDIYKTFIVKKYKVDHVSKYSCAVFGHIMFLH